MLAREDAQIDRNKRQSLFSDFQDQHPCIHVIVNWLFGVLGSDVDFWLFQPEVLPSRFAFFRNGVGSLRSRISCSNWPTKSACANDQQSYLIFGPGVHRNK